MPGRIAFVLIVAAFCAGLLTDRAYRFLNPPPLQLEPVPLPPEQASLQPGGVTMQNCMASAIRRGVTRDQAIHACSEIVN
jgi:hypothetical protein